MKIARQVIRSAGEAPCRPRAGRTAIRRAGALALAILVAGLIGDASRGADRELPPAEEILARSIEAMGGPEKLEQLHNSRSTGTMEMPQMGLKASMESYAAAPAKIYVAMESEGLGTMESGGNGEVYWERSMMTGPKIKQGEELAVARREAMFHGLLKWQELYSEAETVGIDSVDGQPCYQVKLTPFEGRPEMHCYGLESGLLLKSTMKLKTDMGIIPVETYMKDYQETDGVLAPHRVRQVIMGMQEMHFATDSIWYNVEIPDSVFALPPDVEALWVKQQQSEAAAKDAPEVPETDLRGPATEAPGAGDEAGAEEPSEPIELQ